MFGGTFLRYFLYGIQLYLGGLGVVAVINGHRAAGGLLLATASFVVWQLGRK